MNSVYATSKNFNMNYFGSVYKDLHVSSEKVDEDVVNATIECLKANNPSYKGHNAVVYGNGEHDLEFKKNKFVTYTFAGSVVVDNENETEGERAGHVGFRRGRDAHPCGHHRGGSRCGCAEFDAYDY